MTTKITIALTSLFLAAGLASANPVDGWYYDVPTCDNHGGQRAVEELGIFVFPEDELISTEFWETSQPACPMSDNAQMPNYIVEMLNLSGRFWDNLFYVADPETGISNVDGLAWSVNAQGIDTQSFRIDDFGNNKPLIFESGAIPNVFEPGEVWQFIIQDYTNAAHPPHIFGSLDFAGASNPTQLSSGSIVQFVVPVPGSLALLGLGGLVIVRRRR